MKWDREKLIASDEFEWWVRAMRGETKIYNAHIFFFLHGTQFKEDAWEQESCVRQTLVVREKYISMHVGVETKKGRNLNEWMELINAGISDRRVENIYHT